MWPDRVSNSGPLTYESGALPIVLRGPARCFEQLGPGVLVKWLKKLSGMLSCTQTGLVGNLVLGTYGNSKDSVQMPQYAASDQGFHCWLTSMFFYAQYKKSENIHQRSQWLEMNSSNLIGWSKKG